MSIWKAQDFGDSVKPADAGLEPPALTVTVDLKGGKKATALIGNKKGDDEYYVKTPEAPQVFVVKKYNIERVLKRPIEFRDKTLCDIPDTEAKRRPFGVEYRRDVAPVEIADRLGVEGILDSAQQQGKDDHVGAAREVADLLEQHRQLIGLDVRAPFVDLRVRARRRSTTALDVRNSSAMRTKSFRIACKVELLDDGVPCSPTCQPGRHDGERPAA